MYRLATDLLRPGVLLCLLTALALANLWRKRREGRRRLLLLTVPFVLLLVWCIPAVSHLALGSLEWDYPPLDCRPDDVEAIVVLAGYVRVLDDAGTKTELAEDTLYRCLKAAEVYRQGRPCPVVVSGGKVHPTDPGPALAVPMRDFLRQQGVAEADLVVEDRSATTYENAVESCRLLGERGLHKVLLVTDAAHMGRAAACFRKQGVEVVPCGCRYRATGWHWTLERFLPDPAAARGNKDACHEWLGAAWYRLRGRT